MKKSAVATPAYGRIYLTKQEASKDWFQGKDFVYNGVESSGRYFSIRDEHHFDYIKIVYGKNRDKEFYYYPKRSRGREI